MVEHSGGHETRIALTPNRPVAEVTREVLEAVGRLGGAVEINPTPQEVPWTVPLDEDDEHATYDADQVATYFAAATQAALVLAEVRAPFRGRSTPVNAWWGTFDLAVNFFSGRPADPPSDDFIMRNGGDAQQVAIGWWPGDPNHERGGVLRVRLPGARRLRGCGPEPRRGPLGRESSASTCSTGTTSGRAPIRTRRGGVRPRRVPPCLRGVRVGPGAGGHGGGRSASDQVNAEARSGPLGSAAETGRPEAFVSVGEGVHRATLPPFIS